MGVVAPIDGVWGWKHGGAGERCVRAMNVVGGR